MSKEYKTSSIIESESLFESFIFITKRVYYAKDDQKYNSKVTKLRCIEIDKDEHGDCEKRCDYELWVDSKRVLVEVKEFKIGKRDKKFIERYYKKDGDLPETFCWGVDTKARLEDIESKLKHAKKQILTTMSGKAEYSIVVLNPRGWVDKIEPGNIEGYLFGSSCGAHLPYNEYNLNLANKYKYHNPKLFSITHPDPNRPNTMPGVSIVLPNDYHRDNKMWDNKRFECIGAVCHLSLNNNEIILHLFHNPLAKMKLPHDMASKISTHQYQINKYLYPDDVKDLLRSYEYDDEEYVYSEKVLGE